MPQRPTSAYPQARCPTTGGCIIALWLISTLPACSLFGGDDGKEFKSCQSYEDCLKYEDGNRCNGTLYCDDTGRVGECLKVLGSEIACVPRDCVIRTCEPATGECVAQPGEDGVECEDGDKCTLKDTCKAGTCAPGDPKKCDDGAACTVNDRCEKGSCLPGNPALWTKTFGASARGFAVGPYGFVFAHEPLQMPAGSINIARVDSAGEIVWDVNFSKGESYQTRTHDIVSLGDDYVILSRATKEGGGGPDTWLLRIDADGKKVWQKNLGAALLERRPSHAFTKRRCDRGGGCVTAGS